MKRAVYIKWLDHSHCNGWCEDSGLPTPSVIDSIGFIKAETKEAYIITTSWSDDNDCISPLLILKKTIVKIRKLDYAN